MIFIHTLMLLAAILITLLVLLMLSIPLRNYLPKWYVCDLLAWHSEVQIVCHNGIQTYDTCTKCNKQVMRDSQGNMIDNTYHRDISKRAEGILEVFPVGTIIESSDDTNCGLPVFIGGGTVQPFNYLDDWDITHYRERKTT